MGMRIELLVEAKFSPNVFAEFPDKVPAVS